VSVPEASDYPPRFSSGRIDSYGGRLLPICCPMAGFTTWTTIWLRRLVWYLLLDPIARDLDADKHPTGRSCQSCPCGLGPAWSPART